MGDDIGERVAGCGARGPGYGFGAAALDGLRTSPANSARPLCASVAAVNIQTNANAHCKAALRFRAFLNLAAAYLWLK
jgi:hypothetical protein